MPTLGTQNISTSYPQVLKTFGSNIVDGTLRAVSSGDEAGVSALQISTTGVKSTGTFAVDGATTLTGAVTLGSTITASTGTNTLGTISGNTATLGTISGNTATLGTLSVTNGASVATTATVGTAKIGASGPSLVAATYATAAFTGGTLQDIDHVTGGSNSTTGTFAATGVAIGDIVVGAINSIGSTTGITPARLLQDFRVESSNVIRFTVFNTDQTAGTIPSGIVSATALRFTA